MVLDIKQDTSFELINIRVKAQAIKTLISVLLDNVSEGLNEQGDLLLACEGLAEDLLDHVNKLAENF